MESANVPILSLDLVNSAIELLFVSHVGNLPRSVALLAVSLGIAVELVRQREIEKTHRVGVHVLAGDLFDSDSGEVGFLNKKSCDLFLRADRSNHVPRRIRWNDIRVNVNKSLILIANEYGFIHGLKLSFFFLDPSIKLALKCWFQLKDLLRSLFPLKSSVVAISVR